MTEPVPKAGEALSEAVVSLTVLFAMSCVGADNDKLIM